MFIKTPTSDLEQTLPLAGSPGFALDPQSYRGSLAQRGQGWWTMAMKERLTVCSLVPPVLFLATLLVGLGLGTFGTIADMFRLSHRRKQLDNAPSYHYPDFRMPRVLCVKAVDSWCLSQFRSGGVPGSCFGFAEYRNKTKMYSTS